MHFVEGQIAGRLCETPWSEHAELVGRMLLAAAVRGPRAAPQKRPTILRLRHSKKVHNRL